MTRRALTDADAKAALDRMLAEERRKALEEAKAACAATRTRFAFGKTPENALFAYEHAIRALIEKDAADRRGRD